MEREGSSIFCTALFYVPDGTLVGKHSKLMPNGSERLIWGQGDRSTLLVIQRPFGKIGAVICWENYMPLLIATMYPKGIDIYLTPTADSRDSWQSTL